jgi:hypothetical protein
MRPRHRCPAAPNPRTAQPRESPLAERTTPFTQAHAVGRSWNPHKGSISLVHALHGPFGQGLYIARGTSMASVFGSKASSGSSAWPVAASVLKGGSETTQQ